jgi:hypothetical protein
MDNSFDHLVGEQLQRVGHLKAKRPGRLHVDDELPFGRLQDRHVRRLRALEDAAGVDTGLAIGTGNVGSVAGVRQVARSKSTR